MHSHSQPTRTSDKLSNLRNCQFLFSAKQATTKSDDKLQDSTENKADTAAAKGIEAQQFKQWLENYIKQRMFRTCLFFISAIIFI
jgi:hypothetical protein